MAARKGKFIPKNKKKYKGNIDNIVYRSSWEKKFMLWCDYNSSVLVWNSEEVVIPYYSPIDGRKHRYFVDFYVELINKQGEKETKLIEIKPHEQCFPPKEQKRKTRRYYSRLCQYKVNQAKWDAATVIAESSNMKFQVLTEYELGIKTKRRRKQR